MKRRVDEFTFVPYPVVLVFYCCVVIYLTFSSFNNTRLLSHGSVLFVDQKTWWAQLGTLHRVSQGQNQGVDETGLLSGCLGQESTSKFIQIVGRIQFLWL